MKRSRRNNLAFGVCAVLAVGVIWIIPRARPSSAAEPATAPAEESEPVATVQTAPLRIGQITQTIIAYGVVAAEPGSIAVYSVPFDCRVKRVLVTGGQRIDDNTSLLEIEPSAGTKLQIIEASNASEAANKDLKEVQQRFNLKLATNQELLQSQQNQQSTEAKLKSLRQFGAADEQGRIFAKTAGVVTKVDVQDGQSVPADGSLIQVVPLGNVEIRLGAEPSDVTRLHVGLTVRWFATSDRSPNVEEGKIRFISGQINPETRLVDVLVAPDSSTSALLDSSVRGEIAAETKQAVVAPRSAVLPEDQAYSLFTVKDGHAVKHVVRIGLNNEKEVEILGEDLNVGDALVIAGNLELEDGMAVTTDAGASP